MKWVHMIRKVYCTQCTVFSKDQLSTRTVSTYLYICIERYKMLEYFKKIETEYNKVVQWVK